MSETRTTGPALIGNAETNPPPNDGGLFTGVVPDDVTIEGIGTDPNKLRIKAVQIDATLTGSGTVADPLSVVAPVVVADGVTLEGDGSVGDPLAIKAVQIDATLTGSGTVADPLSVPPPVVVADGVTLDGDGSFGDPLAIKAVQTDATLTGSGTVADPLSVAGSNTVEHIGLAGNGPVGLTTISFVEYTGLVPELPPVNVEATLPNGTVDGQQKQIIFAPDANVVWKITPTSLLGGGATVSFAEGLEGEASFVWDNDEGGWWLLSSNGGTLA